MNQTTAKAPALSASTNLVRVTVRTGKEKVLGTFGDAREAQKSAQVYSRRYNKWSKGMFRLEVR
jgi:hypothetical protein